MIDDEIAAAITANKAAWSFLVKQLSENGCLNLSILNSELRNFRHGLQERGEFVLAAALDEHLRSIENWSQDD